MRKEGLATCSARAAVGGQGLGQRSQRGEYMSGRVAAVGRLPAVPGPL